MSDFYENRDYQYDDDSGDDRRKKRRIRQERYTDDAWGKAYYGDMTDGARADIEDWAAGMVDEEGRRYREQRRNQRDQDSMDYADDLTNLDRPELGSRSSSSRPSSGRYRSTRGSNRYDNLSESSAMSRADRLRQRFNRGSGQRGYVEGADLPGIHEENERKPKPSGGGGDFFDALFDFKVDTLPETVSSVVVIAVIAIILISIACIGAAWLTAIEVRDLLNLT